MDDQKTRDYCHPVHVLIHKYKEKINAYAYSSSKFFIIYYVSHPSTLYVQGNVMLGFRETLNDNRNLRALRLYLSSPYFIRTPQSVKDVDCGRRPMNGREKEQAYAYASAISLSFDSVPTLWMFKEW